MKIGFCCKFSLVDDKKGFISEEALNTKITTVAWLKRQSKSVAEKKIEELVAHNLSSVHKLVERVGKQVEPLRMVRLSSDLLPVYTEPNFGYVYKSATFRNYIESKFSVIGDLARKNNVRLSFHPGQFCCIVSEKSEVVSRSIDELEYHSDMIRWMGFGLDKLDFKLNIHLSGRLGVDGFTTSWNQMSPETRNCLTLENDEYSQGLDNLIRLKDKVGIVLDIHHHLIKDEEYIQPTDDRIKHVIESWQGIRPVIHYSQSRDEYIGKFLDSIPTMKEMLSCAPKSKLRQHSDFYNNKKINHWALSHLSWADIMAESKSKNLGSLQLFKQLQEPTCI